MTKYNKVSMAKRIEKSLAEQTWDYESDLYDGPKAMTLHSKGFENVMAAIKDKKVTGWDHVEWGLAKNELDDLALDGKLHKMCLGQRKVDSDPSKASDWGYPVSNDGMNVNYRGVEAARRHAVDHKHTVISASLDRVVKAIETSFPDMVTNTNPIT